MTTVRELHDRAMALADDMLVARQRGRGRAANELALEAFHLELRATLLAFERETSPATRIILLRSTASLAREAKTWAEGMDLAIRALSAPDLREYRTEIFRIVETLRTYEHLSVTGVTLAETDVQLTIAGPDAAPNFARSDEVTSRVDKVRTLVVRSAMRRAGVPYEAGAPRSPQFRAVFTPYLSPSRAASFALTIRFGIDEQGELALLDHTTHKGSKRRPPKVARVLEDVITSARAYAEGGPEGVRRVIQDDSYAKNAVALLRSLSPDSRRIETVGLTIVRGGRANPVALPDREAFDATTPIWFAQSGTAEALPPGERIATGRLLEGNAIHADRAHAVIVEEDGSKVRFRYDEAAHGDIIDGYWKHQVRAKLRRLGAKGYFLQSIDDV